MATQTSTETTIQFFCLASQMCIVYTVPLYSWSRCSSYLGFLSPSNWRRGTKDKSTTDMIQKSGHRPPQSLSHALDLDHFNRYSLSCIGARSLAGTVEHEQLFWHLQYAATQPLTSDAECEWTYCRRFAQL